MRSAALLIGFLATFVAGAAFAQNAWVQIEARQTEAEARDRAGAYARIFPEVEGYALTSGWFAIVLGPYAADEAERTLRRLRAEGMIPNDSFVAFGDKFRARYWPGPGAAAEVAPQTETGTAPATMPSAEAPAAEVSPEPLPGESPAEARRSEAALPPEAREELQEALRWEGFYAGAIDGAIGPGTRRSMADWQGANGHEPTGILTTAERAELTDRYRRERAAFGFAEISEPEAGIDVTIPAALVAFDRYEPPFVHFREKDGSGFRLILISQQGDQAALRGLYDLMQTLEIVPVAGERELGRNGFVISGRNGSHASYTSAELSGGLIKGYTLVWSPDHDAEAARVLDTLEASFRPVGDHALSAGLGVPLAEPREDLLAGLKVRRPVRVRSGFYLDAAGLVATTSEAVAGCARVTLGDDTAARVVASETGLAVLRPESRLAPIGHADLALQPPPAGSEIAVAGYPYGDTLDAAVMSFGQFASATGLNGEGDRARLSVSTEAGDAGGAVLDASGAVLGMLLPADPGSAAALPEGVAFALPAAAIRRVLEAEGLAPPATETTQRASVGALAPEDIGRRGRDLAVLVSCWE
ncbi:MAG: trypsin-like peptidase domain-containing protein [Defluviimonas sp.]|uniref:serine protease n=1 Tax=Albidovulum sp. TaxID=1872424 RepID=UPI001D84ADA7|nr:trypsin-like peptidase domain-containing protein [Paracoccaceae bacterium]MCC0065203.1 trypsin-like peptidase domain-containing protein [Defluviimonas sp.]